MLGTDVAYDCYGISGTDVAYGAMITRYWHVVWRYAMSGTEAGHGTTSGRCPNRYRRTALQGFAS
eukprot:3218977-Rhodomonas_salina.1